MQGIRQSWPLQRLSDINRMQPRGRSIQLFGALLNSGVNRLSIGVQSFQQEFLKTWGVITHRTLRKNLIALKDVGWINFNVDLMFGLPNQTLEQFQFDVKKVLEWDPHTCHSMHLNWPNNPFWQKRENSKVLEDSQKLLLICILGYGVP